MGRSPHVDKIGEHLLTCERCQNELALTDRYIQAMKRAAASPEINRRLRSIHITEDGPIFGTMHQREDGKWLARHWGKQIDGWRVCDSVEAAYEYLRESFHQMFPEHVCSEKCAVLN
jgi:hypothetical protein